MARLDPPYDDDTIAHAKREEALVKDLDDRLEREI
jgi:hypothetical protein